MTTIIMQYQQEWKYYTQILTTVQKELDVASKNVIKTIEEDDPKMDEDARTDKNEKNEPLKKNDKKPEKRKITKSSVDNEVKNTENAEETHVLILKALIKELDETEATITKNFEKDAEDAGKLVEGDGEVAEEKKELEKVTRRRLRQGCAVQFPTIFQQAAKHASAKTQGMCACQGGATGVSQISLVVDAPEEADKAVQSLFQKKLANEAKFLMQVQRTSVGADSKVVVEGEKERMSLVIVANDDKVTGVLAELEEADLVKKGAAIVSPLLQGKREYMKWV